MSNLSSSNDAQAEREFRDGIVDLFLERRAGHLGRYCFSGARDPKDPVRGDEHWAQFIRTSTDYYPYHHVVTIIRQAAQEICRRVADAETLLDLGTGSLDSFEGKLLPVLENGTFKELILVDGASSFPALASEQLKQKKLPVEAKSLVIDNFFSELPVLSRKTAITLFGITLGNIIVDLPNATPESTLTRTMKRFVGALAEHGGYFIFDFDTNNNEASIHKAYDHPAYHAMELTILRRAARDLSADIDPDHFEHVTAWYSDWGLCAQELRARCRTAFMLLGQHIKVPAGKAFRTGNSFKFPDKMVERVARHAGFEQLDVFTIPDSTMRVAVAAVRPMSGPHCDRVHDAMQAL